MPNRDRRALTLLRDSALSVLAACLLLTAGEKPPEPAAQDLGPVFCRALEVHTAAAPAVTLVVFNQRDETQRARLGSLLRKRSGSSVQFQTADGQWHDATVFRLKSAFGRGLLVFPRGTAELAQKEQFVVRFSTNPDKEAYAQACGSVALYTPTPAFDKVRIPSGAVYKGAPLVSFIIDEAGNVADVKLLRSSGIQAIDSELLATVRKWRYKPQPGCGVVQVTMDVNIHFR